MRAGKTLTESAAMYLSDPQLALREWYRDYRSQQTGIPGTEISFPNVDKMEAALATWISESRSHLHQTICVEWNYPAKRTMKEFDTSVSIITALADYFVAQHTAMPSPLALATLLFLRGLDEFCRASPL